MTRDGTFLIENGQIVGPVKNLRFTQSYLEALKRVEGISKETMLCPGMAFSRVPCLSVGEWQFTGTTQY
jgi:predicted Zn-dependent protease